MDSGAEISTSVSGIAFLRAEINTADFRRIALSLEGVEEGFAHGRCVDQSAR